MIVYGAHAAFEALRAGRATRLSLVARPGTAPNRRTADLVAEAKRAGVPVDTISEEQASRLSSGWLYVALGGNRGFPLCLAEAMAAGLPCVAIDSPFHRDIVRHGETGYLCRSQTEVIDRIAQLIDTPRLRQRMGRAARTVARERFSEASFRDAVLSAYQLADDRPVTVPDSSQNAGAAETAPLAMPTAQECP